MQSKNVLLLAIVFISSLLIGFANTMECQETRNYKRAPYYIISQQLDEKTRQEVQKTYREFRRNFIKKDNCGAQIAGLSTIGAGVLGIAALNNGNNKLAYALLSCGLLGIGLTGYCWYQREISKHMPLILTEKQEKEAFQIGLDNSRKNIEQLCKLQ